MSKIFNKSKNFIGILLVAAILFGTGYHCGDKRKSEKHVATKDGFDLKLPGEAEKMTVTINEIEGKLKEIGELSSHEWDYTSRKGKDFDRIMLDDIPVPLTKTHVEIECTGVIKAGYKIDKVVPTIDEKSKTIYIALPEVEILSNEILWDSVKSHDSNNLLNPIDFDNYKVIISEIKKEGLEKAIEEGLYSKTEATAHKVIRNFLGCFVDYKVKFV